MFIFHIYKIEILLLYRYLCTNKVTIMNAVSVTSIEKQFMVNSLDMPYDMRQLINGFCFYDAKTWELIEFIKKKKQDINHSFKTAFSTRRIDGVIGYWVFDAGPSGMFGTTYLHAVNCRFCGNYRRISSDLTAVLPEKITCTCPEPPLMIFDDDDDDESMGETWAPDTPSEHYSDYGMEFDD